MKDVSQSHKALNLVRPQAITATTVFDPVEVEAYQDNAMVILNVGAAAGSDMTCDVDVQAVVDRGTAHADAIAARGVLTVANYALMNVAAIKATGTITIGDYSQIQQAIAAVAAEGTITVLDYAALAGKTITVNSVTKTEGVDFTAETDNDTTATNIAAALTGIADVDAAAVGAVVTITAAAAGTAGNSIPMTSNAPSDDLALSGATLAGGAAAVAGATVTVDGQVLTEGTDFDAETSNAVTATNLAAAIHALANVNATADGNVITVEAAVAGTAGNALTMATNDAGNDITLSGATLAGGAAAVHASIVVNDKTYLEGTDFDAETSNAVTAQNLADAIEADLPTGVEIPVVSGAEINLLATTAGAAANSFDLTSDNAGITADAATFTGGADEVAGETYASLGSFTQFDAGDDNKTAAIKVNLFGQESLRVVATIGGYDAPSVTLSVVAIVPSAIGKSDLNSATLA